MTVKLRKLLPFLLIFLSVLSLSGQQVNEKISQHPDYSGGFYRNYPSSEITADAWTRPVGYVPFYISHYGRHGSRWISDRDIYSRASGLMEQAAREQVLTPEGKALLEEVRTLVREADGREGELSPQGSLEHRGIAERMYLHWPEVFCSKDGSPVQIDSKATVYTRCIYSMIAFDERLKEFDPSLRISRTAYRKDMAYLSNYSETGDSYKTALQVSDSLAKVWIQPDRFLQAIFNDADFIQRIPSRQLAMFDFFHLACSQQAVGQRQLDLFRHFTEEEIVQLWKVLSTQTYIEEGPSLRFGDACMTNAKRLLRNIVETADAVISGERDEAVTLRFGHESNIVPLLCLLQLKETDVRTAIRQEMQLNPDEMEAAAGVWNISEICPMATNLQFIFFRNASGNVKVKVLHNEKVAFFPFGKADFLDWKDLRSYLVSRY